MNKYLLLLFLPALISPTVFGFSQPDTETDKYERIHTLKVSCNKPYKLKNDCSLWSGAKRIVEINGIEFRLAATADGKVVLIMDRYWSSRNSAATNEFILSTTTEILNNHNVHILKIIKVGTKKNTDGYFLELDADGYSLLKPYTLQKKETAKDEN